MNLIQLFRKLWPFVRPYRWLVIVTLILTLIGSSIAQVNAIVLDWTVDQVNNLVNSGHNIQGFLSRATFDWESAAHILLIITIILLGKELLSVAITYAQHYFGERMRVHVSRDLAQTAVDRVLTYRMAYFNTAGNEAGRLQSRIDQGVGSLSTTVQNTFIDLLPLFTSAIMALVLMFLANVYVGLTALFIVPIYIWITIHQANRLQGWREEMRGYRDIVDASARSLNIDKLAKTIG